MTRDPASEELRERIRAAALDLGFDQAGFAPAEPPAHADWYREWLDRGWHGELAYLERDDSVRRRLDPRDALEGCRSLVVVSVSYATLDDLTGERPTRADGARPPSRPGSDDRDRSAARSAGDRDAEPTGDPPGDPAAALLEPIVARYASGNRDYHLLFEERLGELAARVQALAPGTETKPYVDYGPVLERDHAQRAGLGWIGKNTLLIDPDRGSYLLLGELLTTLELPPDEPFTADRCGTCSRCIEACPTDAIRGPRELDARRCISYLTIELKGSIPEELRPMIGNRVFGCDICQEVCPWNRKVSGGGDPELRFGRPVEGETMVEWAEELLELSDAEFRERYGETPYERPGRDGLLRNLCVGLGNSGRPEARPVLVRAARDRSGLVREHARWGLDRLEGPP